MKTCSRCKQVKSISDFYRSKQTRDGYYSWCKECARKAKKSSRERHRNPARDREYALRYKRKHPDRVKQSSRKTLLKRKYGMTPEEYDAMLAAQGGGCAICTAPPGDKRLLPVDHCHETGTKRGILCSNCNTALGLMQDDRERLLRAVEYLSR